MNLTGKWKGHYVYGAGYTIEYIAKSEEFVLEIVDNDGQITGTCTDPIVNMFENNSSSIEGVFNEGYISFIKKYKRNLFIIDPDMDIDEQSLSADGIHYTGRIYKRLFSKKRYFEGEWVSNTIYTDPDGTKHQSVSSGTWRMAQL